MGENLVMNLESKGFTVAVHNRSTEKVDAFLAGRAKGKQIVGCHTLEELKNADKIIRPAYKPLAPHREYIKLDDR